MNFVTGNLIYKTAYDYAPNELVAFKYLGKSVSVGIDNINNDWVTGFLIACGIPAAKIITARGFGSSTKDSIEIFFAYEGTLTNGYQDLWVENQHHAYASYARQDGIIIPQYYEIKAGLDAIALKLAKDYKVISFLVKPFSLPALPIEVLAKSPVNGFLADMRNIPGSWTHVLTFKKANWQTIWYQDKNGKQKVEFRPKTGWVI
ncbi:MAG: hypothetical protein IPG12_14220 [Saprospiraceae bacterium]|nr:hypothetical protein [Saprospiraceae bacterium]